MNTRIRTTLLAGLCLGCVLPLAAQREREPERRTRIWVNGEEMNPLDLVASRRARIGVVLNMAAIENDSVGATISSVTPGGPAAKAGIRSGDIITRIDGQKLVNPERNRLRGDEESLAALRLIEIVAKARPGDTVSLEYRRGSDTRTATVITDSDPTLVLRDFGDGAFTFRLPELRGDMSEVELPRMLRREDPNGFAFRFGGAFADLELAPINPDLGAYFGTSEGVLVIDTPARNSLGLRGGDVILNVDGRPARGPSSLLRILRSYEPGDPIKLEILRNRSRQTITSKVEGRN